MTLGAIPRKLDLRDIKLGAIQAPIELPKKYETDISWLRSLWQNGFPACGSHAGTHLKMILDYFDTGAKVYSPNYLWIKIKQIDGYPLEVGTDMRSIFKTLQSYGVCDYDLLPNDFTISLEEYSNSEIINKELDENAQPRIIKSYAFGNDIKKDIYLNKAVIILIDVGETWWTREMVELPKKNQGGHFVVAYGFLDLSELELDGLKRGVVTLEELEQKYGIK